MKPSSLSTLVARVAILVATINSSVWAMGRPNADPNAPPPPAWTQWVPMIMLLAVFYLFLLRPQAKQRRERESMLNNLKKGDKLVTQSGFIVTVMAVGPKTLEVKLNDDTRVKMLRSGVSEVLPEAVDAEPVEPVTTK